MSEYPCDFEYLFDKSQTVTHERFVTGETLRCALFGNYRRSSEGLPTKQRDRKALSEPVIEVQVNVLNQYALWKSGLLRMRTMSIRAPDRLNTTR